MSSVFSVIVLSVCSVAVIGGTDLQQLTKNLMKSLNPNGADSHPNGLLLQLTNGEQSALKSFVGDNSQEKLKLEISFVGTVSISAQRNDQKVVVSTDYLGGLGLQLNANQSNANTIDGKPVDPFLKNIYEINEKSQKHLSDEETAVLIAHGSLTGTQIVANNYKLETDLIGGFVVGSKTRVQEIVKYLIDTTAEVFISFSSSESQS
ncbi:unnamed protein product [Oppiella nova]|uniref:Uncharacterized protein n=1 Tax=Oppiella nova TaxID=334625 RepID=A0A7R9MFV7_9ACAR|nr:unnamed protein product [Oppiella nova]CAG2176634.1 unnamed protein product [Oppiella nova]